MDRQLIMRPVVILQHQVPENAAYLKTWLERHGIDYVVFNAGLRRRERV